MQNSQHFKQVILYIPNESELSQNISNFTPDEILIILSTGMNYISECKSQISNLSNNDKIQELQLLIANNSKYQKEIEESIIYKHNLEIQMKETYMADIKREYNQIIEQLKRYNEQTEIQHKNELSSLYSRIAELNTLNNNSKDHINELVESKIHEKLKLAEINNENEIKRLISNHKQELDHLSHLSDQKIQIELANYKSKTDQMHQSIDNFTKLTDKQKSAFGKGVAGELKLINILHQEFGKYAIIEDSHHINRSGDFTIIFDNFRVMVDAKSYGKPVGGEACNTFKKYLSAKPDIKFGWFVSLNTNISNHNKSSIDFEAINSHQFVLYFNNLDRYNPNEMITLGWAICKLIINHTSQNTVDHVNDTFNLLLKEIQQALYSYNEVKAALETARIHNSKSYEHIMSMQNNLFMNIKTKINLPPPIDIGETIYDDTTNDTDIISDESISTTSNATEISENIIVNNEIEPQLIPQNELLSEDEIILNWWNENATAANHSLIISTTNIWNAYQKFNSKSQLKLDKFRTLIKHFTKHDFVHKNCNKKSKVTYVKHYNIHGCDFCNDKY